MVDNVLKWSLFPVLCCQGWYLYLVTVRWFGLRIDLLSSIFLIAVAFFSIPVASRKLHHHLAS